MLSILILTLLYTRWGSHREPITIAGTIGYVNIPPSSCQTAALLRYVDHSIERRLLDMFPTCGLRAISDQVQPAVVSGHLDLVDGYGVSRDIGIGLFWKWLSRFWETVFKIDTTP